jgi:hypothetical protein
MMEITCTMAVAAEAETDRLCRAVLRIFALRHGIGGQLHGSIGNDLGIWILVGSVAAGQKKEFVDRTSIALLRLEGEYCRLDLDVKGYGICKRNALYIIFI